MRFSATTLLGGAALALTLASAEKEFEADIPNSLNVQRAGVAIGAIGHTTSINPDDDNVNIFGDDYDDLGEAWTQALCQRDSDGDGFTNGEELGDPDCTWVKGQVPKRTVNISHPAHADSVPSDFYAVYVPLPTENFATTNKVVSSAVQTTMGGQMTFSWSIYAAADAAATTDDVFELTMTTPTNDQYVSFGMSPALMTGPFIACVVQSSDGTPLCSDWTGKGLDVARRITAGATTASTQIVSSEKLAAGGYSVTVRMLASELNINKAAARAIVAVGPYDTATNAPLQHTGTLRTWFTVDVYSGATPAPTAQATGAALPAGASLVTSTTNSIMGGKMTFAWSIFAGDTAATTDDVVEMTMTTPTNDQYVSFGMADELMTGPFFACVVQSADGAPLCSDWMGSGLTVATRSGPGNTALTQVMSSSVNAGGGYSITIRILASDLAVRSTTQRAMVAVGTYLVSTNSPAQHVGADTRQAAQVNMYSGTASTGISKAGDTMAIIVMVVLCIVWLIIGVLLRLKQVLVSQTLKKVYAFLTIAMFVIIVVLSGVGGSMDNEKNGISKVVARAIGSASSCCLALLLFPVPKHIGAANLIGSSFERAIPYHTVLGTMLFLLSTLHGILMMVELPSWTECFLWDAANYTNIPLAGFLSWLLMFLMVVPSFLIRRSMYSVFRFLHCLWPGVIILAILHTNKLGYLMIPSLLNLFLDFGVRIHSHFSHAATIVGVRTEGVFVELVVSTKLAGVCASQFALIGVRGHLNNPHPFSIASYDAEKQEAHFFIKAIGPWTSQLAIMAQQEVAAARAGQYKNENAAGATAMSGLPLVWQGPYGQLEMPLGRTPNILLVGGGIGFTPMLNLMDHVAAHPKIANVTVAWVLRDIALLRLMNDEVAKITARLRQIGGVRVSFTLFMTGHHDMDKERTDGIDDVVLGRPDIAELLADTAPAAGEHVTLYACGPSALMDVCADAVSARGGGTFLHTETFEM